MRTSKRPVIRIIATATFFSLGLAGCSSTVTVPDKPAAADVSANSAIQSLIPQNILDAGVIRAGSSLTLYPLYFYEEGTNNETGLIVDVVNDAVERVMGLKIEYQQIPYAGLITALDSEKIDIGVGHFETTEASTTATNIVSTNLSTAAVTSRDDTNYEDKTNVCGAKLGISRGAPNIVDFDAINEACAEAGLPDATLSEFQGAGDMVVALQSARIDGYLGSSILGAPVDGVHLNLIGAFQSIHGGFAVNKGNDDLAEALAAAINVSIAEGGYEKIVTKWEVPEELWIEESVVNYKNN